jgi:hypothetical protein
VARVRERDVVSTATEMVQSIRSILAENEAGTYLLSPATRHRDEGALVALEALLGEPPGLLGHRADEFRL